MNSNAPSTCGGRRDFLKRSAAGLVAGGVLVTMGEKARAANIPVNMQVDGLSGAAQLGEIVAKQMGFFRDEGIDFAIQPGGPNNDGVAMVASGRYEVGLVASSPSLMLAVSQEIPIKCFAVGVQQHPYAYFSLAKNPVRTPADFRGKTVGTQGTGQILLRAMLLKNHIDPKDVKIQVMSWDMVPIMTGQVDVVTAWLSNTAQLAPLGADRVSLRLWDAGVKLYANPYYATHDSLQTKKDVLIRFLRAAGRGWAYAQANPDKSAELLIKEYPNYTLATERDAAKVILQYAFSDATLKNGWGSMDPAIWQAQIDMWSQLGQFTHRVPSVDDVMTLDILAATADSRPKIG